MSMSEGKWRLKGYDTFAREHYPLQGEYATEEEARAAARAQLQYLEEIQPTKYSGGQSGIQDWVYVIRPDGNSYRVRG